MTVQEVPVLLSHSLRTQGGVCRVPAGELFDFWEQTKRGGKMGNQTEEDVFYELCHANSFWIKAPPGHCEPDIKKKQFSHWQ